METASFGGLSILAVEDDDLIAQYAQEALQQAGATVVGPAPSVHKALRLLESITIDAAVLDVNLRSEKSHAVAEVMGAKAVPFLSATGCNSADIPEAWQHAVIVTKPRRIGAVERLLAFHRPG